MSLREMVQGEIVRLDENRLQQVADYLAFLRFQSRQKPAELDETHLAALYAEFGAENRAMAEENMTDYAAALAAEDAAGMSCVVKSGMPA